MPERRGGVVRFAGSGPRSAPLTWAQRSIWNHLAILAPEDVSHFLSGACPVPDGGDVEAVLTALRLLIERHETLRTLFGERAGVPFQRVLATGEIDVTIVESGGTELEAVVDGTRATLARAPFDSTRDLPFRAGIVLCESVPRSVVLAASHLAVDGWSFKIVCEELAAALTAPDTLRRPAQQPVDRARYEASAPAGRRARAAIAHWDAGFRQAPEFWLTGAGGEDEDIEWLQMSSQRLATALARLADLTKLTPTMVLQAVVALRLCLMHGVTQAALRLLVSPRFRPESRDLVGSFNQQALLRFDVIDESFLDFLRRAGAASLLGYARCEYDPCEWDELFLAVHAERGIANPSGCTFNDARIAREAATAVIPLERAAPAEIVHLDIDQRTGVKFFLYFLEMSQTATLRLAVDRRFIDGAPFLLDLEAMLVAGLERGSTISRLAAIDERADREALT